MVPGHDEGENLVSEGSNSYSDNAFDVWREAMLRLTFERTAARSWRRTRYSFAHRLGDALVGAIDGQPPITGPVIYGVWLRWGLLYIGQTSKAERRLRDLAVGESHHLANTFPPEIWHRVVVLAWPELPQARSLVGAIDAETVGLAVEFALQEQLCPVVNSERRRPDGGWRDVVRQRSKSRGALAAHKIVDLVQAVRGLWDATPSQPTTEPEVLPACRVVFPEQLLLQPYPFVP